MSRESDERHTLTVEFDNLRPSQVQTLRAMFGRYESLGKFGASRKVSLFADGDGPFHPLVEMETTLDDELTDAQREAAEVEPGYFDADALVGEFRDDMDGVEATDDE